MLSAMIADTAFQTSSPWLCDFWIDGLSDAESGPGMDPEKSGCGSFDTWDLDESDLLPGGTISDLASFLSNDDDDEDDVCLENIVATDIDLLSTSILSLIDEGREVTEADLLSMEAQPSLNDAASVAASSSSGYSSGCESCNSNEDAAKNIPQGFSKSLPRTPASASADKKLLGRRRKQRKQEDRIAKTSHQKWSGMSEEEQREVINDLTQVISSQLGMRERLEAIRIINPHARVSPTDTECYIDMTPINDSRFTSLQRFVRLHTGDPVKYCSADLSSHNKKRQDTFSSAYVSDHLVMCAKSRGRKRKGRSSRREQKALCQQLSKEEIQRLKEEQSGYFVHEVRIAVSSSLAEKEDDDDDGNIDILE